MAGTVPTATGDGEPGLAPAVPPQTPLFRAAHSDRYQRQDLIREIERATRRPLVCMVFGREARIDRGHFPAVADLVHGMGSGTHFDVLLHSLGGDLDAAAKIAFLLRRTAGDRGSIRVIVPDSAKSAGTLIALAGDRIMMSDTSELGPIDPLISVGQPDGSREYRPAQAYLDAHTKTVSDAAEAARAAENDPRQDARPGPPPVPRQVWEILLNQFDPALVEMSRKAIRRSTKYAEDILRDGMFRDGGQWTKVAHDLSDNSRWLTHGAVIDARVAMTEVGLNVDLLARMDPLWQAFWRLYCLQRLKVDNDDALFESDVASLSL